MKDGGKKWRRLRQKCSREFAKLRGTWITVPRSIRRVPTTASLTWANLITSKRGISLRVRRQRDKPWLKVSDFGSKSTQHRSIISTFKCCRNVAMMSIRNGRPWSRILWVQLDGPESRTLWYILPHNSRNFIFPFTEPCLWHFEAFFKGPSSTSVGYKTKINLN